MSATSRGPAVEHAVAVGLVVGWVCLAATARWAWRFVLGSHQ